MAERTPVPAGLRELIGLLAQLADTPLPAEAAWEAYRVARRRRVATLTSRLTMLADVLAEPDDAQDLASYCERSASACRAALAEPLGYEPHKPERSEEETGGR
jgi:hypothetical protein